MYFKDYPRTKTNLKTHFEYGWIMRFARFTIRFLMLLTFNSSVVAGEPGSICPSIGAIRWDAWFGKKGAPGLAVEKTLGPYRFHDRVPLCGDVLETNAVRIDCNRAGQIEDEIKDAADAGIKYWAFVAYSENDPMSISLLQYLNSNDSFRLNFSLISELDRWKGADGYRSVTDRYIKLMMDVRYQRTPDDRPIFFIGFIRDDAVKSQFGGWAGLRGAIDDFRNRSRLAGLKNPYLVALSPTPRRGAQLIELLELDAISAYAIADRQVSGGTYADLATLAEAFWSDSQSMALPLVPLVMTGWDRRPRALNPVPWEGASNLKSEIDHFYQRPTMDELQQHATRALMKAKNANADPASTVLVYAWNEFDEGGWIAPTHGDEGGRLKALRRALNSVCK